MEFTNALIQGDLEAVRRCPKADLHNHFVLGGSREYLREYSGKDIQPIKEPIHSMNEMHTWTSQNLGDYSETVEGRRMLIRATFSQAKKDGVSILEIGEDVWGLGEFFHGNIEELVAAFETAHQEIARILNCGFRLACQGIAIYRIWKIACPIFWDVRRFIQSICMGMNWRSQ